MKIFYRKLNEGESYCCSQKAVKELFNDSKITVNFGNFGRNYSPQKNECGYSLYKKKIIGKVIASLTMQFGPIGNISMLSFYIVKDNEFTSEMREYFEKTILHKIYNIQIENLRKNKEDIIVLVEKTNESLNIYEGKI